MGRTKIEWCARLGTIPTSWNPVTGCSKISEGCKFCYAERMARRLAGRHRYPEYPHHFDVTLHPDRLEQPLKWKKPRTVFVCSMSDLFHEKVPDSFVAQVFGIMAARKKHIFQVLTKRPKRMRALLSLPDDSDFRLDMAVARNDMLRKTRNYSPVHSLHVSIPLPNVWLGITAENQAMADERIPLLLQAPTAVRFVSCEPLLEEIHIEGYLTQNIYDYPSSKSIQIQGIDWIIVGGESGPNARPMYPQWARDIRDQCQAAGVPLHFKQHGAWLHESQFKARQEQILGWYAKLHPDYLKTRKTFEWPDGSISYRIGKKRAGRLLDGKEWSEFPQEDQ